MRVFVHSGHLSVDNGAVFPLSLFSELAKLMQTPANWGPHYGHDSLDIDDTDWPTLQAILVDCKLLYRVEGLHHQWQNVQTQEVQRRLQYLVQ